MISAERRARLERLYPSTHNLTCSHAKLYDINSHYTEDDLPDAAKTASQCVVGVSCRDFEGTGIIIECTDDGDGAYTSTILAPAMLLPHVTKVPLQAQHTHIEVDVYLSDNKLYKGKVLACDVHYNLATIGIKSDFPLTTAVLRGLDDTTSLDLNELHQLCSDRLFQLRPHSNLFRIMPGTKIIVLRRISIPPYDLEVDSGVFCADPVLKLDSQFAPKELCWLHDIKYEARYGGAVMNCLGEVVGIMFGDSPFLPSNFIIRWWSHNKSNREFVRPWLGMDIFNLYAANMRFLGKLKKLFDISSGIVVTKVKKDSPAHLCGIMPQDVIVKCDGLLVRSKVEFLEKIWDNSDKSVELEIVRASDGCRLNRKLAVGKTTSNKVYRWPPKF